MYELAKLGGFLISPLTLALGLWAVAAGCVLTGRRRWALSFAAGAFVLLWLASTPAVARALAAPLEDQYAAVPAASSPPADAIVVLGGALAGASPPRRPTFSPGQSSGRIWHAADLYRVGKAQWIVIAAGNQPGQESEQAEADAIAEMLVVLGVPPQAILRDDRSRNTRENAAFTKRLVEKLGAKRVLLVTSARHMPRALKTFTHEWSDLTVELVPSVTDVSVWTSYDTLMSWMPSAGALGIVTATLKEYAGYQLVGIM